MNLLELRPEIAAVCLTNVCFRVLGYGGADEGWAIGYLSLYYCDVKL